MGFFYSRYRNRGIPLGLRGALRVLGVAIGRITSATSSTDPANLSLERSRQAPALGQINPCDQMQSNPAYYNGYKEKQNDSTTTALIGIEPISLLNPDRYDILTAFMACFTLESREQINSVEMAVSFPFSTGTYCVRRAWDMFCHQIPSECQDLSSTRDANEVNDPVQFPKRILTKWLEANSRFLIQGRTLEDWRRERVSYARPLLPFIHSFFYFIFECIAFCIAAAAPTGVFLAIIFHHRFLFIIIPSVVIFVSCIAVWTFTGGIRSQHLKSGMLLKRCQPLSKPWRKMILADKGFLGMAHEDAQQGDELFYLVGCQSAVVLREVRGNGSEHHRPQYTFVGQSYVYLTEKDRYKYCGPIEKEISKARERNKWDKARRLEQKWHEAPKQWALTEIDLV
jgi:hypothetical protein